MTRSSLLATGLAALALGTAAPTALAADPPPPTATTGISSAVSFRNSRPLLPADTYRVLLQATRATSCLPPLPPGLPRPRGLPPSRVPPRTMTFSVAMTASEGAAGLTGAKARRLRKLGLARTPGGAERLAAVGVLSGGGKGGLAALLVAARANPRDPLLLIDAAALLIDGGRPNEALALLKQAQTLPQRRVKAFGLPTLAILETNRAAALFRTGQYAGAAAAGRRAVRRSAWLVEARENRAMALLCMGREEEAACEFREAAKRPLEEGEERLTCVGRATTPQDFGFTVGTPGTWPAIGYPALPSKADGYVQYYPRLQAESHARSGAANDRYNTLIVELQSPVPGLSPVSKGRASDVFMEMQRVPLRPEFQAQLERGLDLSRQIGTLAGDTLAEVHRIQLACGSSEVCVHDRCGALLQQTHPVFLARQTELESTMRAWWRDLHAEMEGYQEAIGDERYNELAATQIDTQSQLGWNVILTGAVNWNGVPTSLKPLCLDPLPEPPVTDPTVGPDGQKLVPCPPRLDELKAKFDIGEGVVRNGPLEGATLGGSLEVKCSEVTVEASGSWNPIPLVGGFGSLALGRNAQGGTLTMAIGSKGSLGPASFTSGLQLTLQQHAGGTNVDLAWKVGPSVGPVSDIIDIPIWKSVAPPAAGAMVPLPK